MKFEEKKSWEMKYEKKKKRALEKKEAPLKWEHKLEYATKAKADVDADTDGDTDSNDGRRELNKRWENKFNMKSD
ncbi:unnamed protein product [Prunus armeniaca]|uniref:Uncharacterized protein n=1 Tax=Prunus armeniaca TaxID=36596 RepID=A0A6J5VEJ7_PRUAR|nr:unnamed protein product [Prunus armeniaca]